MSFCAIDAFKDYLLGENNDNSIFSPCFIALRDKDYNKITSLTDIRKHYSNKIENVVIEKEDSHYLIYYVSLGIKYIIKARLDQNSKILSLVEEIYDESLSQVLLEIEYDGSRYSGMQKQSESNLKTIQGEIEKALKKMLNKDVQIIVSSRTDAKVHAKGQRIQFPSFGILPSKYAYSLNNLLPDDIRIKNALLKSQIFHARYDTIEKEYEYVIDTGEYSVFNKDYVYYQKINDIEKLKRELKEIEGCHDYYAFCRGENDNTIRTIYKTDVEIIESRIVLRFIANGFLHNMIRFIVGALIDSVNNNKPSIKELLDLKDKNLTPKLAPASGLYLIKIKY
ncbi:tRNA pseudouridine(38-40) synthase TruA [bacterium]|nr:tRNA pseudouridine(38-40) synthase TruA [bacterium]